MQFLAEYKRRVNGALGIFSDHERMVNGKDWSEAWNNLWDIEDKINHEIMEVTLTPEIELKSK